MNHIGWDNMPDDDPRYQRTGQWVRRNSELAEGTIVDLEGNCLIINAPDIRAAPFKVHESKVTILEDHRASRGLR